MACHITPSELPGIYTPSGANIFATGSSSAVPPNTIWDVNRFEQDLAALNPSHQISAINTNTIDQGFGNGYLAAWNFGLERRFAQLDASVGYIGTAGVHLPAVNFLLTVIRERPRRSHPTRNSTHPATSLADLEPSCC